MRFSPRPPWTRVFPLLSALLLVFLAGCVSGPQASSEATTDKKAAYEQSSNLGQYREGYRKTFDGSSTTRPKDRVFWLGVSTNVPQHLVPDTFPILAQAGLLDKLNRQSLGVLREAKPAYFNIVNVDLSQGAEARRGGDLGMALLLNSETRHATPTDDGLWRADYRVIGQLIFIDLDNYVATASFPVGFQYTARLGASPSEDEWRGIAEASLQASGQDGLGLAAQLRELLASDLFALIGTKPRLAFDGIQLSDTCLAPACSGLPSVPSLSGERLTRLGLQWSALFWNFVGAGTDHVISPYVASPLPGRDNRLSLYFPDAAYLSSIGTDGSTLELGQGPPALRLRLRIRELSCEVDPEMSGKYVVSLIYGFRGTLQALDPLTDKTVFEAPLNFRLADISRVKPEKLSNLYWNMERRKVTPAQFSANSMDHYEGWSKSMEHLLEQIKNEIFFQDKDLARRFPALRSNGQFHSSAL